LDAPAGGAYACVFFSQCMTFPFFLCMFFPLIRLLWPIRFLVPPLNQSPLPPTHADGMGKWVCLSYTFSGPFSRLAARVLSPSPFFFRELGGLPFPPPPLNAHGRPRMSLLAWSAFQLFPFSGFSPVLGVRALLSPVPPALPPHPPPAKICANTSAI